MGKAIETLLLRSRYGVLSRVRIWFYRSLGMRIGKGCRLESVRIRRPAQIVLGEYNAFTEGCWLWPIDEESANPRIRIGDSNYFNRDVMIDACGSVEVGSHNMFGPGVYITDSNHTMSGDQWVCAAPMQRGRTVIGNGCWIGARAVILKDVKLGDRCLVAAGAVVTKSFPPGSVIAGVPAALLREQCIPAGSLS
jgi:acetyltransferase-like isoleucine patch superfamily enzyme